MKTFLKSASVLSLLIVSLNSAQAVTINGNASATVLAPLAISETTALQFGNVAGDSGTSQTVAIDAAGAVTLSSGVVVTGTQAAAEFAVTGESTNSYTLTLPATITITEAGLDTMTISSLVNNDPGVLSAGTATINVGGTLTIGTTQTTGAYTGTYSVTVEY